MKYLGDLRMGVGSNPPIARRFPPNGLDELATCNFNSHPRIS